MDIKIIEKSRIEARLEHIRYDETDAGTAFLGNLCGQSRVSLVDVLKAISVKNDKLTDGEIAALLQATLPFFGLEVIADDELLNRRVGMRE